MNISQAEHVLGLLAVLGMQTSDNEELLQVIRGLKIEFEDGQPVVRIEAESKQETCPWTQDIDGNWIAACGVDFILIEGTPFDNSMAYCCGCGKKLEVIVYTEPEDEEDEQKDQSNRCGAEGEHGDAGTADGNDFWPRNLLRPDCG